MSPRFAITLFVVASLLQAGQCFASAVVIDKIYHPYVQPGEQELEWRGIFQNHQPGGADNLQLQRLAYGRSVTDRWFLEFYLVGEGTNDSSFDLKSYELEAKRQLTEQGEFWADWGLLLEIEKEADYDAWALTTGLLIEKEWGRFSSTANLLLVRDWGSDVKKDWETRLGFQLRYRYSRAFEPAIEYYSGNDTQGVGPAILGQFKAGVNRQLHWEAAAIFGVDNKSPDLTWRFNLEFEF